MCQLLGMNCNVPTDICFSFSGFQARGGLTDIHKDGWGIAFFEGKAVRQFLDPEPSAHSPIAELVRQYPIKSKNVVSHIRKATQGEISLENTHPFCRELWGRSWIFAHNGNLKGFHPELDGSFEPIGSTDSELGFCFLMQGFRKKFGRVRPHASELFKHLTEMTKEIGAWGEFNFLLCDGESLFAHCSTQLSYVVRKAPFASARLKDQDVEVDFSTLTSNRDRVAIIATLPLTENENWNKIEPGTLVIFQEGEVVQQTKTIAGTKKQEATSP